MNQLLLLTNHNNCIHSHIVIGIDLKLIWMKDIKTGRIVSLGRLSKKIQHYCSEYCVFYHFGKLFIVVSLYYQNDCTRDKWFSFPLVGGGSEPWLAKMPLFILIYSFTILVLCLIKYNSKMMCPSKQKSFCILYILSIMLHSLCVWLK